MLRRLLAIATLRAREGARGPLLTFLLVFLALAVAAVLFVPGEPGLERQRAVDALVLDTALLLSVLAAAALGAASLPADREAGREDLIHGSPVRPSEMLVGGLLGHGACLAVLLLGMCLGSIGITGLLAGGDSDRSPTRTPLRAELLADHGGEQVLGRWTHLTPERNTATFTLEATTDDLEPGCEATLWVHMREIVDDLNAGMPEVYPVGIRIGDGPERILRNRTGNSLELTIQPGDLIPGGTPVTIRRIDPAYTIGLAPGGLVVQGMVRSFPANLLKALLVWFFGLLVVSALASTLGTVLGAPVATAGALIVVLVGRSSELMVETAAYLAQSEAALSGAGLLLINAARAITPDFLAYDLTVQVTSRWDIAAGPMLARLAAAVTGAAAYLAFAWIITLVRRRV